jgi:hypothetical protein
MAPDDGYLAALEKGALLASRESDRGSRPASVLFKGQSVPLLKATLVPTRTSVVCIARLGLAPSNGRRWHSYAIPLRYSPSPAFPAKAPRTWSISLSESPGKSLPRQATC